MLLEAVVVKLCSQKYIVDRYGLEYYKKSHIKKDGR